MEGKCHTVVKYTLEIEIKRIGVKTGLQNLYIEEYCYFNSINLQKYKNPTNKKKDIWDI